MPNIPGLGSMVGLPCRLTDNWDAESVITDVRAGTNGWDFFIQPTGRARGSEGLSGRWVPAHSVRTPLTMDEEAFRRQVTARSAELNLPPETVRSLRPFTLALRKYPAGSGRAGDFGWLRCGECGWAVVLDDPLEEGIAATIDVHRCG